MRVAGIHPPVEKPRENHPVAARRGEIGLCPRGINAPATLTRPFGAELDLLITVAGKRYGFDFKFADAPGRSRSMGVAIEDLKLDHLWVIYPGLQEYPLEERITVAPMAATPRIMEKKRQGKKK